MFVYKEEPLRSAHQATSVNTCDPRNLRLFKIIKVKNPLCDQTGAEASKKAKIQIRSTVSTRLCYEMKQFGFLHNKANYVKISWAKKDNVLAVDAPDIETNQSSHALAKLFKLTLE